MEFSRQECEVGCHFLLQGIFLTQRLNPRLLNWWVDSLPLSHLGWQCCTGERELISHLCLELSAIQVPWKLGETGTDNTLAQR